MFGPTQLSDAEIDQYSITHYVASGLNAAGWTTVSVDFVRDGWPDYDDLGVPGVYIDLTDSNVAGIELGSHGKSRIVSFYVYGANDAQRNRLADSVENTVRDVIPFYDFVDGNETSPDIAGYFLTDSVRWEKIPSVSTTPDKEKWRAVVTATLRRQVA